MNKIFLELYKNKKLLLIMYSISNSNIKMI